MCVLRIDGRQVDRKTTFDLGDRKTRNIATGPTTFLGQTLCHAPLSTAQEAGKCLSSEFSRQLHSLDLSPIGGEFKLWIYRRFMVSCSHFHLALDTIPASTLKKMQANAMRRVRNDWASQEVLQQPSSITPMSSTYHLSLNSTPKLSSPSCQPSQFPKTPKSPSLGHWAGTPGDITVP